MDLKTVIGSDVSSIISSRKTYVDKKDDLILRYIVSQDTSIKALINSSYVEILQIIDDTSADIHIKFDASLCNLLKYIDGSLIDFRKDIDASFIQYNGQFDTLQHNIDRVESSLGYNVSIINYRIDTYIADLFKQIDTSIKETYELKDKVYNNYKSILDLRNYVDGSINLVKEYINASVNDLSTNVYKEINNISTNINDLSTYIINISTNISKDVSLIKQNLYNTSTDVSVLIGNVYDISTDVSLIKQNLYNTSTDVSKLINNVYDISTDVSNLIDNVYDISTDVSTVVKKNIYDISTDVSNLKGNVYNISTNVKDLSTYIINISSNVSDISTDVSLIKQNLYDTSTDVSILIDNVYDISTDVSTLKAYTENLSTDINGRLDVICTSIDFINSSTDALDTSIRDIIDRFNTLTDTSNANDVIDTFKEVETFLNSISDASTLTGILQVSDKKITEHIDSSYNEILDIIGDNGLTKQFKDADTSIVQYVNSSLSVINTSIETINSSVNSLESDYLKSIEYTRHIGTSIFDINDNVNEDSYIFDTYKVTLNKDNIQTDVSINVINKYFVNEVLNIEHVAAAALNDINGRVNANNDLLNIINTSIGDINSSLNTINTSISDINSSLNTINTSISYINSSLNTINTSISYINSSLNTINTSISDINSSLNTVNTSIGILDTSVNSIEKNYVKSIEYLRNDEENLFDKDNNINENSYLFDTYTVTVNNDNEETDISIKVINKNFIDEIIKNELVVSSALNDLNTRMNDIAYRPSDDIPDDALSIQVGNMEPTQKSELAGLTFSAIFDRILFKDTSSYYNINTNGNLLQNKYNGLEVGQTITDDMFTAVTGTATYGYPEAEKAWTAGNIDILTSVIVLGKNENVASCEFSLLWNNAYPVIKTLYGKDQNDVIIDSDVTVTKYASITGYYNWGWFSSNDPNVVLTRDSQGFNVGTKITTSLISEIIDSSTQSSYVYIALPKDYTITDIQIQDPLNDSKFNSCKNVEKVSENAIIIEQLSTINEYHIWRAGKSINNADGTVTANNKLTKIIASK